MAPGEGLEPPSSYERRINSAVRFPIPAPRIVSRYTPIFFRGGLNFLGEDYELSPEFPNTSIQVKEFLSVGLEVALTYLAAPLVRGM